MLRPFRHLFRLVRRHIPGRREQLVLQLLHSIVVDPMPRAVPVRASTMAARPPRDTPSY